MEFPTIFFLEKQGESLSETVVQLSFPIDPFFQDSLLLLLLSICKVPLTLQFDCYDLNEMTRRGNTNLFFLSLSLKMEA